MEDSTAWRASASLSLLRKRAELLRTIRQFFADRSVLEVETPVLSSAATTDHHLHSLTTRCSLPDRVEPLTLYLNTSPELAMKRLLASGSGSVYQISRVFRDREKGALHNPEFTLLEWYRSDFNHHDLMDETGELLRDLGLRNECQKITCADIFREYTDLDIHTSPEADIRRLAQTIPGSGILESGDRSDCLDLIFSHLIIPQLGRNAPVFLYDYPASQAALAKTRGSDPPVAERFELFINGIEIANGFHELTDASEQRRRFEEELNRRNELNLPSVPRDERFLAALEAGMPACAGVALGIDRLLMTLTGAKRIEEVMAFPVDFV